MGSGEVADGGEEWCSAKLDKKQVNQIMTDIKWLFKNYKDLEVLTMEDSEGKKIRFII